MPALDSAANAVQQASAFVHTLQSRSCRPCQVHPRCLLGRPCPVLHRCLLCRPFPVCHPYPGCRFPGTQEWPQGNLQTAGTPLTSIAYTLPQCPIRWRTAGLKRPRRAFHIESCTSPRTLEAEGFRNPFCRSLARTEPWRLGQSHLSQTLDLPGTQPSSWELPFPMSSLVE